MKYYAYYLSMSGNIRRAEVSSATIDDLTACPEWGATKTDGGVAMVQIFRQDFTPENPIPEMIASESPMRFGGVYTWTPGRHPREVCAALALAGNRHADSMLPILFGDLTFAEVAEDGTEIADLMDQFSTRPVTELSGGSYDAWVALLHAATAKLQARAAAMSVGPVVMLDAKGRLAGIFQ